MYLSQPENVVIEHTSTQPLVKLTDFGDAAHLSNAPYIHPLLGSPEFSAPELVLGEPAALASDLWSLGVLAYVMLSGASPFLDESVEETCLNICRLDYSFPEDYFYGVSQVARDFIRVLLQGEPCRRPTAQVCLREEPWLQPNAASGSARLDTSRLISFIERRKHQNDLRPVSSLKAFLRGRLLSQTWDNATFQTFPTSYLNAFQLKILQVKCKENKIFFMLTMPQNVKSVTLKVCKHYYSKNINNMIIYKTVQKFWNTFFFFFFK